MGSVLVAALVCATGAEAQTTTRARSATVVRRDSSSASTAAARATQPARAERRADATVQRAADPPAPPCLGPTVELRRANGGFVWRGAIVDCHGRVRPEALAGIAALASPQSGQQSFSPDLPGLAAQIRRVAPVAGWAIAEPPPERASRRTARTRATRGASGASVAASNQPTAPVCPRGQELAEPTAGAARDARESSVRGERASAGARQLRGRARARSEARCRPIEVARDAHTHDAVLEGDRRVRVLHPRLLEMLARVAAHWPGRAIEVVSGYRPSNDPHAGSRHAHARALDFRVVGVAREALRDFCRTLPLAGVGYYPHSVFVHLDVRDRSEGSARWTDYSEPGERPRYGHWPPSADDVVREMQHITQRVDALLEAAARTEQ